ncbi:MAG: YwbE family protein [Erysipelothrix sp.]|nr:YwbE family protein [Erysipelothrix sp.]
MKTIERKDLAIGQLVKVVLKQDQRSGNLTEGVILRFLTKSPTHPHGIKVMLDDGRVGRVKEIVE